jgi:hypothetical protein
MEWLTAMPCTTSSDVYPPPRTAWHCRQLCNSRLRLRGGHAGCCMYCVCAGGLVAAELVTPSLGHGFLVTAFTSDAVTLTAFDHAALSWVLKSLPLPLSISPCLPLSLSLHLIFIPGHLPRKRWDGGRIVTEGLSGSSR